MINATVDAATDHEVLGSTAFPNFTNGAVDNYYTMAHSHIDNSPFAEGTGSPADTGPVGQTAAAGNFAQPQYADARWPGDNSGKATFGNQGGPYSIADASSFKATAHSEEASSDSSGSSGSGSATKIVAPAGFAKKLKLALAAWKARWLVPLGLKKIKGSPISLPLPTVSTPSVPGVTTPTVTTPKVTTPKVTTPSLPLPGKKKSGSTKSSSSSSSGGGGVLQSSSLAQVDPKTGAVVTSGQSSLGSVNLGGGQIVIDGINVSVSVTNTGKKKPSAKIAVNVADASIGGVPVTIDQNGVQVQGQGQALPYQQADDALNSALKQAGVQIFTVQPEVKKSTNELTVTATGVHVLFTQPVDQSGIPAQNVEHIFGDVFVDSLAAPAPPVPNLGLSGSSNGSGTSAGGSSGTIGGSTGTGSSSSYGGSPTSGTAGSASQAAPTSFTSLLTKPGWLLIAYLVWQAMVIGTGASLWRWRAGMT